MEKKREMNELDMVIRVTSWLYSEPSQTSLMELMENIVKY